VFNYGDYQRAFGGLSFDYPMSYAVRDFFDHGGSQAIIVRLFEPVEGDGTARLAFPDAAGGDSGDPAALLLKAANPGPWGNTLTASIDTRGIDEDSARPVSGEFGLEAADLFNLDLTLLDDEGRPIATERFLNLSVKTGGAAGRFPNRIDRLLMGASALARVDRLSAVPPGDGASARGAGGDTGRGLSAACYLGDRSAKTGMYALDKAVMFNLLCIPPDRRILPDVPEREQDLDASVRQAAASYCAERRAFYIVDPPAWWSSKAKQGQLAAIHPSDLGIGGEAEAASAAGRNAAVYFPRIWKADPLMESHPALFAPCGAVAGVYAATDLARGVWKAPAVQDASLADVIELEVPLTDDDNAQLNPLGINCLRQLPILGPVVWGARTLRGGDQWADAYKYVSVRRLTLLVEESLIRGTQWAIFEPNDEALWSSLRLSVGSFLADLSRQGAFYNYNVQCDVSTTTADDIERGVVNILVRIAPVKPDEFVVLQIQHPIAAAAG
jgi:hypothetical protein